MIQQSLFNALGFRSIGLDLVISELCYIKETKSATMNIFRNFLFSF